MNGSSTHRLRLTTSGIRLLAIAAIATTLFGLPVATRAAEMATPSPSTCAATPMASENATPITGTSAQQAVSPEAPAQPEQNPAGDIPDSQVFVTYTSAPGGYSISMPEGWSRQENGANVTFADKLHDFSVAISCANTAPTTASATAETQQGGGLQATTPAFELVGINEVQLPAGSAIHIAYRGNSVPDDVTGTSHRVDIDRYELFHNGALAVITLTTPAGSDNVDVAKHVSESFTWLA